MSKYKNQARRDKARQKKQADKVLIQLAKERRELWEIQSNAPLVRLDKPYQRGWTRSFALTEEVTRRKDAERFKALLKYVQCIHYSQQRHFMEKIHWRSKRLRPRKHRLKIFTAYTALKLKIPEDLLSYLVTQKRRPISTRSRLRELMFSGYKGQIKVRHPHYFISVTEPYMITHRRVALPDVDRRLAEVEFILEQEANRGRLYNLQCSHSYVWEQLDNKQQDSRSDRAAYRDMQIELLEYYMEENSITQEKGVIPTLSFFFIFSQLTIFNN